MSKARRKIHKELVIMQQSRKDIYKGIQRQYCVVSVKRWRLVKKTIREEYILNNRHNIQKKIDEFERILESVYVSSKILSKRLEEEMGE